jgi:hypothetical protein
VMKINGTRAPWVSNSLCSSIPFIAGIWTSAITQDVLSLWPDRKNSSADANVWAAYPCDLKRLFVPIRTDASSSMIEITGVLDKLYDPSWATQPRRHKPRGHTAPRIRAVESYLGLRGLRFGVTNSERFGHSHQIGQ